MNWKNFNIKIIRILLINIFAISLIFGSGCTRLPVHSQGDVWTFRRPNVQLKIEDIDDKNAKPSGNYTLYKQDFEKQFKQLMSSKDITKEGDPVNLNVQLEYEGGIGTFGQYFMAFLTTPLFFLSFIPQPHNVPYTIDYSVKSASGIPIIQNKLQGRIQGRFKGWSAFRFLSRSWLYKAQGPFFSEEAAILVFNDISKNWMEYTKIDTNVAFDSSDIDYRAQARKMIRVEQLLKEAAVIYPEGKEIKQLQKRLNRVKARIF